MSLLQVIERAALSLPEAERRELVDFLTAMAETKPSAEPSAPAGDRGDVHPDLKGFVGILLQGVRTEEIHEYRLLKHS